MSSNKAWDVSNQMQRQNQGSQANVPTSQASAAPTFNAQEVRDYMKNAFRGNEGTVQKYKPAGTPANNARSSGPWTKPSNMSNNKDFYAELRKQVSAMQQGERAGG